MRVLFLILIVFLFIQENHGQSVPEEVIPNIYKKFFRINDKDVNLCWDMKSSGGSLYNIFGNNYLNVKNQQWMVMPLYPEVPALDTDPGTSSSNEFVLVNRATGGVLDRHHGGNLYVFNSDFHGGKNQIFKLLDMGSNYYAIKCSDIYSVADLSRSNGNNNPFTHPGSSRNNIYCFSPHFGNNQQFKFTSVASIEKSSRLSVWRKSNIKGPPSPYDLDDRGHSGKYNYKQVAQTIIPFFLVNDEGVNYLLQISIEINEN